LTKFLTRKETAYAKQNGLSIVVIMLENLLLRFRLRGDLIYVDAELMSLDYCPKMCGKLFLIKFCSRIMFVISMIVTLTSTGKETKSLRKNISGKCAPDIIMVIIVPLTYGIELGKTSVI
tara:strand:- start:1083 stop:1442 length:360 start_codon:yes stop_codon:yes gene_type:complete